MQRYSFLPGKVLPTVLAPLPHQVSAAPSVDLGRRSFKEQVTGRFSSSSLLFPDFFSHSCIPMELLCTLFTPSCLIIQ